MNGTNLLRTIVCGGALMAGIYAAHGFGLGRQGHGFGKLGAMDGQHAVAPPSGCASPTAPNGQIDFSQCSNAFYVSVIF